MDELLNVMDELLNVMDELLNVMDELRGAQGGCGGILLYVQHTKIFTTRNSRHSG
jgi:hypothetical protein